MPMPPVSRPFARLSAGALLITVAFTATPPGRALAQQAPPTNDVPVTATAVQRRDLPIYARGIGTVQAWRSVDIRAQVTGYLQSIDFREGQEVKAGDVLATIDPRPYQAIVAQAQAKKAADQATLTNNQVNLQRDSALEKSSFASRQQVDNDTAAVRQFEANIQADDAAIQAAQLNLDFCRITAPIDGVVGFRLLDKGNLVAANGSQTIVTLAQVRPVAVVFTLPQEMLPQARTALAAGAPPVLAYSADESVALATGKLLTPNNSIDVATGTISLKAIFPNENRALWPGQFVSAHLQLRVDTNAVVVPLAAVQHGPDGLYVFIAKPDGTAHHQDVTVGYQDSRVAEVTKGLDGGERIVVDGQARLQDGTRISVRSTPQAS
jgi:multidrug efflux system membrane fusion protein